MIALYYQDIYITIVSIITILTVSQYNRSFLNKQNRKNVGDMLLALLVAIFMIIFIGLRPCHEVFADMLIYDQQYQTLFNGRFFFEWDTENKFFDNWVPYMASKGIPSEMMFFIYALIYFGAMYFACKKFFPNDILLSFVFYLGAFSTFSYGVNGVRAGMAASLFLLALAHKEKIWISLPLAIFTFGMHHSMSLVIGAYLIVLLIKQTKYYFALWAISFVIAALHITFFQHFFAGFTDEHGAGYLLSNKHSGFRLDFIIYSAIPILCGFIFIYKYKIKSDTYNFLLSIYTLANSVWLLCMYSSFTNRIAYLSWFMYPIVLLYPFLNVSWSNLQCRYLKYVVYGHLGFTLFMNIVYYTF